MITHKSSIEVKCNKSLKINELFNMKSNENTKYVIIFQTILKELKSLGKKDYDDYDHIDKILHS